MNTTATATATATANTVYVQGSLTISPRAYSRLQEIGVQLKLYPFETGGDWDSLRIPVANWPEFRHIRGNPGLAGRLYLESEFDR